MEFTLTFEGILTSGQSGGRVAKKTELRRVFSPQIEAHARPYLPAMAPDGRWADEEARTWVVERFGHRFVPMVRGESNLAAAIDIQLLAPPSIPLGDGDNLLKTLLDGLTMPPDQQHVVDDLPNPLFTLLDDDKNVAEVTQRRRAWFGGRHNNVLVVIHARLVQAGPRSWNGLDRGV